MITNADFLAALFAEDAPFVHCTDFMHDPNNIPKDRHLAAWKGDYFSRYQFGQHTNQYFTISNFYADEQGVARRRKALFRHTPVIVLDDVKEKLSMVEVGKLPSPSWILETSLGSEQWGYILDTPCTDRAKVENLLDGLVANGLAPEGRDPGMKGVTRYVRLPEGCNNKASKLVNGQPFDCQITLWQPFHRVSIWELAAPFAVDLNAIRREARVDGASDVASHPLVNIPDIIHIKDVRSDGRFDITCPWVGDHTGGDDSGAAVFTNSDNSIGFKCHHGACQSRTGRDLLQYLEDQSPGFGATFGNWKIMQEFAEVSALSFMDPITTVVPEPAAISFLYPTPAVQPVPTADGLAMLADALRRQHPSSPEARQGAAALLKAVDELPKIDQKHWHEQAADLMNWSKVDLKDILTDLRKQWYGEKVSKADFYDTVIYVKEQNQFFDWKSRIFFSPEAFQNSYSHEDAEARKIALQDGRVRKVDRLDYAPKQPRIFVENGTTYGNTWCDDNTPVGVSGDVARWLGHWDAMGWSQHKKHMLQWMAYTVLHPEKKINHMLLLGSSEGCGKDYLLYPLMQAMCKNSKVISGEELLEGFNDYVLSTKYLHINEAELGDRREAMAVSNKLKPLASAPPDTLRVNQKGIKPIEVRNIINASMTTNSQMPLRLNGPSRRFYAVWSDLNPRDSQDNMKPEWLVYWEDRWGWIKNGGYEHCIWYLRNCVDLSDFNPAEAPPMTEFLRDIRDASKSPMQQTIEAFVERRLGAFQCDVLTARDMSDTLKAGQMIAPNDMHTDGKRFTPVKVGMLLKEIGRYAKVKTYNAGYTVRLWILRDIERYQAMTPVEVYREYERQLQTARANAQLTVVK